MKACATESFQWTQRVQKEPFLGPKWGPIKWGHFTPPFGGGPETDQFEAFGSEKVVDLVQLVTSVVIRLYQDATELGPGLLAGPI